LLTRAFSPTILQLVSKFMGNNVQEFAVDHVH
jgi:hypothetical protein